MNRGPCLQAKSTNLFLPQSFQNSLPNGGSAWSASSSFTIPRSSNGNVRSRLSEKLQSQHLYLNEDDSDVSDTKSDCSRQTSVCPVDSTTKQTNAFSFSKYLEITHVLYCMTDQVKWWCNVLVWMKLNRLYMVFILCVAGGFLTSPGFIGFVLGASVIGNLALACYVFRISWWWVYLETLCQYYVLWC